MLLFVNILQNKVEENVRSYNKCQTVKSNALIMPVDTLCWGRTPQKNYSTRIDAPSSRQPLVKGERLIRYEVSAAISELMLKLSIWIMIIATRSCPDWSISNRQLLSARLVQQLKKSLPTSFLNSWQTRVR